MKLLDSSTMKAAPSLPFRRLCLGLALLATTWTLPNPVRADAYVLQTVKGIVDQLKPNVLIVLETAESMQGLPGENRAAFNDVGADCEDGNRHCRLVGQSGRWNFSGMGKNGVFFGSVPASCTSTSTYTYAVPTTTSTSSISSTTTQTTITTTATASGTQSAIGTATASSTATGSGTTGATGTATASGSANGSWTATGSNSIAATGTRTATATATAVPRTVTATGALASSTIGTATGTVTLTGSVTVTDSATLTGTVTGTTTVTESGTVTASGTATESATVTVTGSITSTGSVAVTGTANATGTVSATLTVTLAGGQTATNLGTSTVATTVAKTATTTASVVTTASATALGTNTVAQTMTATGISTSIGTATATGTVTATASKSVTASATAVVTGGGTANNTAYVTTTAGGSAIYTTTATYSASSSSSFTWKLQSTGTFLAQATDSGTSVSWVSAFGPGTLNATGSITQVTTSTDSDSHTRTATTTQTVTTTASATQAMNNLSFTYTSTGTSTKRNTTTLIGTTTWTSTASVSFVGTWSGSGTSTGTFGSSTATTTSTTTLTTTLTSTYAKTGTACATITGSATVTEGGTLTGTPTITATGTVTGSASATGTGSVTATASLASGGSMTGSAIVTATGTVTGTVTTTGTGTVSTTTTTTTTTDVTTTYTVTATTVATGTQTISTCNFQGNTDPNACGPPLDTTTGYCNYATGYPCTTDGNCTTVRGDFCRAISSTDGSGRPHNEVCNTSNGSPWGSCKQGVTTANTSCASSSDSSCGTAMSGDYCAEGQPAKMCADSGIWCANNGDCPGDAATDTCVPATSRMMTVKRALRRAVTDYADRVNFGFMTSYQGRGIPATATDASTAIYPYVKLQACPSAANATETRLLTRGELEKAGCFTLADGPSASCTVDYGGNGALNANGDLNKVLYGLVGSNDSRWSIPRTDGTGKYNHVDASWSTCSSSSILPACVLNAGTALYEGSYYSFSFKQGIPIANSGVDGEGSLAHPTYFTSYMGKYYASGGNCYNAVDAQRTDIVNDGVFGRVSYTGHPYNAANEIGVPWAGSTTSNACDAGSGALWTSAAVPFLNDTTFNGKTVTRAQKALMTAGRLDKASLGGVDATGALNPLACQLNNEGAPDRYHSAAHYMAAVQSTDTTNNNSLRPCWSNNIILVVDGQADGYGDMGSNVDCASTQCAYNAATNPNLTGCTCAAITKAYSLAHGASPVQTHVVVNAPPTWNTRFPYTHAFLWNLALAGSPNFDGTPSFGSSEDEVYKAISDKIAAASYRFTFTTTGAVAGATSQDPTTQVLKPSTYLYDTSVDYPSWKGRVRAYRTTGSVALDWDAVGVAQDHPVSWTKRNIYFSTSNGTVTRVGISDLGAITNKGALHTAGLGATADEAELIMRWLLGDPSLNNPTPLMGSVSGSTPIVVGQPAANGLNGSTVYSQNNYLRPEMVYVGGDDGMLHAFYAHAKPSDAAGVDYAAGEEAFAFIPYDMLPVINKHYAQGGQLLSPDKGQHIFGLASSPKVKDMCIGSGCLTSTGSDWHTVLVMPEGPGGNSAFALDISNVISEAAGSQPNNLGLLWSTALTSASTSVKLPAKPADATVWDGSLGETTAVPAFYFNGYVAGRADNRLIMASGYATKTGSNYSDQGIVIVNAVADTGEVKEHLTVPTASPTCSQKRAVMADVGVARDYSSAATSQNLMAAYVADTWGNTYQYLPGSTPSLIDHRGCGQPLHYAPAVVQLDRAPKADTSSKHFIYLAQVTNSNQDPATQPVSGSYPASQIVVTKLDGNVSPPIMVTSYNATGQIILSAVPSTGVYPICIQKTDSGTGTLSTFGNNLKTAAQACADAGGIALPQGARPMGTPTAVLRSDGLGFQLLTTWYDATAMTNDCSSGKQFNYGMSYITVHEFGADGTWYQIAGLPLTDTVLTGVTFAGTALFVDGITNGPTPQSIGIGETFGSMQQLNNASATDRYSRTTWTERLDLF